MPEKLEWEALEYPYREKTPDWFWALGIIATAATVTAVIFGNILFAVLIVIGSFTLAMYAARAPRRLTFRITDRGVTVGPELHPYSTLHCFWVEDREGTEHDRILLKSNKFFSPQISIPLGGTNPETARSLLLRYLKEEEHKEGFSSKVLELFGY